MISFCINSQELRKALKEIEIAESNGFHYCLAVFNLIKCGKKLDNCIASYGDLVEKAHPTKLKYDWGRGQDVTKTCKFEKGKIIEIN